MSKLKLLLLGGIFSLVGIFNFSSASTPSFILDGVSYSYSSVVNIPNSLSSYNFSYGVYREGCRVTFRRGNNSGPDVCYVRFENNGLTNTCSNVDESGSFGFGVNGLCGDEYNASIEYLSLTPKPYTPVDDLGDFMTSFGSVVSEFIPYISYIGIGVISALLGFFAIRRLINWVRNNTLSVFKSRRKK